MDVPERPLLVATSVLPNVVTVSSSCLLLCRVLSAYPVDERPYDPRPYDSRYSRGGRGGYDDYGPPRARRAAYDDDYRGGGGRDYDRGGYRDYDRGYDRGAPYERRYDDRRY